MYHSLKDIMGVQVSIKRKAVRANLTKYNAALHARTKAVWNGAISAYITAVGIHVAVHQDTGMSLASLFPLARKVKAEMPALATKTWGRLTYTTIDGRVAKGVPKTSNLGQRLGEKSATINYGTLSKPVFRFTFEIKVFQYLLNEFGDQSSKTTKFALYSMEAGRWAMRDYLKSHSKEIFPKFNEYFTPITEVIV